MKYAATAQAVSLEDRARANHRIVNLILTGNLQELTPTDVFNQFTGKGGLHNLDFKKFDSYNAFAEAKKAVELGQFFTPDDLCRLITEALRPPQDFHIADITCGKGSFFNHLPETDQLHGNELDPDTFEVCRFLFPHVHLENKDFLRYSPKERMDLIIGNPPFNLHTEEGASQFAFVKKAWQLLAYGGLLAFIVPISFLADEFQDKHKIELINEQFNFIAQTLMPSDTFDADIQTKLVLLQKKGVTNSNKPYHPKEFIPFQPDTIYQDLIAPLYQQYYKDRLKRKRLHQQDLKTSEDVSYKITRRLWHVKENTKLYRRYYDKAQDMLKLIETQQQTADVSDEDWELTKMTPEKVLAYLQDVVRNQNKGFGRRILKLVKTQYGVKYKAYCASLIKKQQSISVHEIMNRAVDLGPYQKHFEKKNRRLELQNTPFTQLPRNLKVDAFLDKVELAPAHQPGLLFQADDVPTIRPNAMQKQDLGLILQKDYGLLAWEQGGGKSVAGMLWIKYHQGHFKNCYIVGPAIAIDTTWKERLEQYGFPFTSLETITDVRRIQPGQIVLVSYDRLIELQRFIKAHVKRASYKIALLVDESDELTNPYTQRSHATLHCFRKCRYKLLTTGTTTRNTINELYTQLELLYNNSTAFTCWASTAYRVDDEGNLVDFSNPHYSRPFPPHFGSAVFRSCFCPMKSTVFGIQKDNQDIYNESSLRDLVQKTIITRKFEEIVGEKKYSIHMHQIDQTPPEADLYKKLMKDFMSVCYDYYTRAGNERKDAGLRLVRQMQVMIKATSIPHKMKNYAGDGQPRKFQEIADLIRSWPNELVCIGTTLKETAHLYLQYLASIFPNRKLCYIDGEMPVPARRKVLQQFKMSKNGILIATQQALKSSVNIPYCNKCIVESMQWNIPKIAQFYFRFIRFDSIRHTEVHFVHYRNTIEINLMALLMTKELLNDFIKTTNKTTTGAIYEEYGIDMNILDMMIQKSYDEQGNLSLTWGQQRLVA